MTTDLAEFLRARYAEARARAEAATQGPWAAEPVVYGRPEDGWGQPHCWEIKAGTADVVGHQMHEGGGVYREEDARHIAAQHPMAVLADLDSKLAVLDHYGRLRHYAEEGRHLEYDLAEGAASVTLKLLATPFTTHPDYREEWRP
jgi:hypothetical protein